MRKFFSRKKILWLVAVGAILTAAGGWYILSAAPAAEAAPDTTVKTAVVRRGNLVLSASGTGTLVPGADSSFGFRTAGQVVEVIFQAGDRVAAGQILARLDSTDAELELLQARRVLEQMLSPAAIAAAEWDVANSKTAVKEARNTLIYLISPAVLYWEEKIVAAEGEFAAANASAGTPPAPEEEQRIADAEKALARAQSGLRIAQAYYREHYLEDAFTFEILDGKDWITVYQPPTEDDIAAARASFAKAKLTLQEDEYYLLALTSGSIPEGAKGSKITALEKAQQAVASAKDKLAATQLIAPISGTVLTMDFGVGDFVGTSVLVTVADLDHPAVRIYLDEADLKIITPGCEVEVVFNALPEKTFSGRVSFIEPQLAVIGGVPMIQALAVLDEESASAAKDLPSGLSANVEVIGGRAQGVLLVPVEAIKEIAPGSYAVFVVVDGKLAPRSVKIGLSDSSYVEVISGLEAGEVVSTGSVETED